MFLIALASIWLMLLYHMFLALGGYLFSNKMEALKLLPIPQRDYWPKVSIFIPAHNEAVVIRNTLNSMVELDYPLGQLEVIVINDNSSDQTGEIVEEFAAKYSFIKAIHTFPPAGGKGKSTALNRALQDSTGEYIAVYDADNNPERSAIKHLVNTIIDQPGIGAVVGKFRVINAHKNLLTRFINIETISFQWMAQAGRWQWFRISTIPGTNFLIRRSVLDQIGGWDVKALAEDTELSIRVYEEGYEIQFHPLAITWEQEPETWKVWFKQRTRWARGNQYVILMYIPKLFAMKKPRMIFDIVYFFFTYFLFLGGVLLSNSLMVLSMLGVVKVTLPGPFLLIWMLAYVLYIIEIMITLGIEKTELTFRNFLIVLLMYVTYSQLWIVLVIRSMFLHIKTVINKKEVKWDKTERFQA
ncbi:glycosyltransferase family 2 protein [Paenibacillus agricola]|uniref:Glycosyltransferase family 2 protein n=1 Tax=Paenibacillus agricola TaxID=2716264 RepID=A0ABX0JEY4_9BACL|nr:glycosyltransferase [Paenibacillus agricola]NHN33447.1 glycosyltransferase family 2 protein [Paenibacillus agricola]